MQFDEFDKKAKKQRTITILPMMNRHGQRWKKAKQASPSKKMTEESLYSSYYYFLALVVPDSLLSKHGMVKAIAQTEQSVQHRQIAAPRYQPVKKNQETVIILSGIPMK